LEEPKGFWDKEEREMEYQGEDEYEIERDQTEIVKMGMKQTLDLLFSKIR